jgi:hypothetical protein
VSHTRPPRVRHGWVHLHIARIGLPAGETVVLLENHKLEEI